MKILYIFLLICFSSCTVQKVYTDGKVVKDSVKVKIAGYELRKSN